MYPLPHICYKKKDIVLFFYHLSIKCSLLNYLILSFSLKRMVLIGLFYIKLSHKKPRRYFEVFIYLIPTEGLIPRGYPQSENVLLIQNLEYFLRGY